MHSRKLQVFLILLLPVYSYNRQNTGINDDIRAIVHWRPNHCLDLLVARCSNVQERSNEVQSIETHSIQFPPGKIPSIPKELIYRYHILTAAVPQPNRIYLTAMRFPCMHG